MTPVVVGQSLAELDSPQLLLDLDRIDTNLRRMFEAARGYGVAVRVHYKSLKCTGLARYIAHAGANGFLCAKLNEAEALVDAGLTDVMIANQVVGPIKLKRLAELAKRSALRVCVDDAANIAQLAEACREAGSTLGVLVEVDIGLRRCGVTPGQATLELARKVIAEPGLNFLGLQGYDGHLQLIEDPQERRQKCLVGMELLIGTRKLLESQGVPVQVVTGAGTGTWEFVASYPGITEIQPGSFVFMDVAYHKIRPEFVCAMTVLTTVVSRKPDYYVLDAGSKAISKDFGMPVVKDRPHDTLVRMSEEHANVESTADDIRIGSRVEVIPAHCCATMNLHRVCLGIRNGQVEHVWPIESSGRYD